MKLLKLIAILFFALAINTQVNASTKANREKKTAESVLAFASSMETFDADVLKAEIRKLSIPERVKLVKLSVADAKKAEAAALAASPGSAAARPSAGLYILAVLIPPVAVGIHTNWQLPTLYNLLWTLIFWLPGVVHAIIVLER